MAVLKIACPKCGQKVSGDDSFYGTSVVCPICSAKIDFPPKPDEGAKVANDSVANLPTAAGDDAPPQPHQASAPAQAGTVPPPPGYPKPQHQPPQQPQQPPPQQQQQQPAYAQQQPATPPPGQALPQGAVLPGGPIPQAPVQSPYGMPQQPGPGQASAAPDARDRGRGETNDDAGSLPLISLIAGIASMATFPCVGLSILCGPAAIVTGHVALIRLQAAESDAGKGKVLTGLILGYVSLVLALMAAVVWVKVIIPRLGENGGSAQLWQQLCSSIG